MSTQQLSAPNLPAAPADYQQRYHEQFSNVLRQFFTGVTSSINAATPYAALYSTATQTNPVASTANAITFGGISYINGFREGAPTSKIYAQNRGIYLAQLSVEVDKSGAGADNIYLWYRVNGLDAVYSARKTSISGTGVWGTIVVSYFISLDVGDYLEFIWAAGDTTTRLYATTASSPVPGIPSSKLDIQWVSAVSFR